MPAPSRKRSDRMRDDAIPSRWLPRSQDHGRVPQLREPTCGQQGPSGYSFTTSASASPAIYRLRFSAALSEIRSVVSAPAAPAQWGEM